MAARKVIIDCDTGIDDAMALTLALRSPVMDVIGVTCVAGNAVLENVVRNTLVVVEHSGKQVPVYAGAVQPLMGKWRTAEEAHGKDGLGDLEFAPPTLQVESEHAVDYLVRTILESSEPIQLVTLAPLTNIALALSKDPRIASRVHSIVMMAGGMDSGNQTPAAEFNVWVDPEAADIVFRCGAPLVMIGLDPILKTGGIFPEDVEKLESAGKPWCDLVASLLRWNFRRYQQFLGYVKAATPPDMLAVGVAIDPGMADDEMLPVVVECNGTHTRGMTLVDRRFFAKAIGWAAPPNVNVVKTVDNLRYRKLVLDTLLA